MLEILQLKHSHYTPALFGASNCIYRAKKDATNEKDKVAAVIEMDRDVVRAAGAVACVKPRVIVWACTSGSFLKGIGYDREIIKDIEKDTGIPAITTSTAVVDALKTMRIRKLAVATPYIKEIDEKERYFQTWNRCF